MTVHCRFCAATLSQSLVDLGKAPLANSYLAQAEDIANEQRFPLHVMVCNECWLVQTTETIPADAIFHKDYAYLSSYSASWVNHARSYAMDMAKRFDLDGNSMVVEIASNDGYLLQHFAQMGVPVLGVEPAGHAASLAIEKGVPSRVEFFGEAYAEELVREGFAADLMAANNVLAHVPDIRDFIKGFKALLKPKGVATFEFPHVAQLIQHVQFDTIYHEHYSYLSLLFLETLLSAADLQVFDVEELTTHGGSLRLFVGHPGVRTVTEKVDRIRALERDMRLDARGGYDQFGAQVAQVVSNAKSFLETQKQSGKSIAGYGAAAKGNTFLHVAEIGTGLIDFVVDRNPEKQGTLLPGSHIPVVSPDEISDQKPDFLFILPWNIAPEVMQQQSHIRNWGGRFVTAIPRLTVQ